VPIYVLELLCLQRSFAEVSYYHCATFDSARFCSFKFNFEFGINSGPVSEIPTHLIAAKNFLNFPVTRIQPPVAITKVLSAGESQAQGRIWRGGWRRNSGSEGKAVETTGVSPMRNSRFLPVSILARTRFREEETISLFSTLPLILLPHQQNGELSIYLREIETTFNIRTALS
jgi:hypothetical protein